MAANSGADLFSDLPDDAFLAGAIQSEQPFANPTPAPVGQFGAAAPASMAYSAAPPPIPFNRPSNTYCVAQKSTPVHAAAATGGAWLGANFNKENGSSHVASSAIGTHGQDPSSNTPFSSPPTSASSSAMAPPPFGRVVGGKSEPPVVQSIGNMKTTFYRPENRDSVPALKPDVKKKSSAPPTHSWSKPAPPSARTAHSCTITMSVKGAGTNAEPLVIDSPPNATSTSTITTTAAGPTKKLNAFDVLIRPPVSFGGAPPGGRATSLPSVPSRAKTKMMKEKKMTVTYEAPSIDPPKRFDSVTINEYMYPVNLPMRTYQRDIVDRALRYNTLVCLPTGLGKTFIAAVVMFNYYRWFPDYKVAFVAPTKPLVQQQLQACYNIMHVPQNDMVQMTGATPATTRTGLWRSKRVFFMTPQILNNDITAGRCDPSSVSLVVFDEAHHARGDAHYCRIVRQIGAKSSHFRVLALSATPGRDVDSIQEVISNLRIARVEARHEEALDVQPYTHAKDVLVCTVKMGESNLEVSDKFKRLVLQPVVGKLMSLKALHIGNPDKVSPFMLLKERDRFVTENRNGLHRVDKNTMGIVHQYFAIAITVFNAYKSFKTYGLHSLFDKLQEIVDNAQQKGKSNTISHKFYRESDFLTFKRFVDEKVASGAASSAKLTELRRVLEDHFQAAAQEHTCVMIFSQFRDSVLEIERYVRSEVRGARVAHFVGQGASKVGTKEVAGQSQMEQQRVVADFRKGLYNVLVATCIGEEGLDIGEIDLIVCFDAQASPTRMIQRMGRTGRKRRGRCILILNETETATYKRCLSTQKQVTEMLMKSDNDGKLMLYSLNPTMLPSAHKPVMKPVAFDKQEEFYDARAVRDEERRRRKTSRMVELSSSQQIELRKCVGSQKMAAEVPSVDLSKWLAWQSSETPVHQFAHGRSSRMLVSLVEMAQCLQEADDDAVDEWYEQRAGYLDLTSVPALEWTRPASRRAIVGAAKAVGADDVDIGYLMDDSPLDAKMAMSKTKAVPKKACGAHASHSDSDSVLASWTNPKQANAHAAPSKKVRMQALSGGVELSVESDVEIDEDGDEVKRVTGSNDVDDVGPMVMSTRVVADTSLLSLSDSNPAARIAAQPTNRAMFASQSLRSQRSQVPHSSMSALSGATASQEVLVEDSLDASHSLDDVGSAERQSTAPPSVSKTTIVVPPSPPPAAVSRVPPPPQSLVGGASERSEAVPNAPRAQFDDSFNLSDSFEDFELDFLRQPTLPEQSATVAATVRATRPDIVGTKSSADLSTVRAKETEPVRKRKKKVQRISSSSRTTSGDGGKNASRAAAPPPVSSAQKPKSTPVVDLTQPKSSVAVPMTPMSATQTSTATARKAVRAASSSKKKNAKATETLYLDDGTPLPDGWSFKSQKNWRKNAAEHWWTDKEGNKFRSANAVKAELKKIHLCELAQKRASVPVTPAPVTPAPAATLAPIVPGTVTPANAAAPVHVPVTSAPVTPAPVGPVTPAPVAPVTPAVVAHAPITLARAPGTPAAALAVQDAPAMLSIGPAKTTPDAASASLPLATSQSEAAAKMPNISQAHSPDRVCILIESCIASGAGAECFLEVDAKGVHVRDLVWCSTARQEFEALDVNKGVRRTFRLTDVRSAHRHLTSQVLTPAFALSPPVTHTLHAALDTPVSGAPSLLSKRNSTSSSTTMSQRPQLKRLKRGRDMHATKSTAAAAAPPPTISDEKKESKSAKRVRKVGGRKKKAARVDCLGAMAFIEMEAEESDGDGETKGKKKKKNIKLAGDDDDDESDESGSRLEGFVMSDEMVVYDTPSNSQQGNTSQTPNSTSVSRVMLTPNGKHRVVLESGIDRGIYQRSLMQSQAVVLGGNAEAARGRGQLLMEQLEAKARADARATSISDTMGDDDDDFVERSDVLDCHIGMLSQASGARGRGAKQVIGLRRAWEEEHAAALRLPHTAIASPLEIQRSTTCEMLRAQFCLSLFSNRLKCSYVVSRRLLGVLRCSVSDLLPKNDNRNPATTTAVVRAKPLSARVLDLFRCFDEVVVIVEQTSPPRALSQGEQYQLARTAALPRCRVLTSLCAEQTAMCVRDIETQEHADGFALPVDNAYLENVSAAVQLLTALPCVSVPFALSLLRAFRTMSEILRLGERDIKHALPYVSERIRKAFCKSIRTKFVVQEKE